MRVHERLPHECGQSRPAQQYLEQVPRDVGGGKGSGIDERTEQAEDRQLHERDDDAGGKQGRRGLHVAIAQAAHGEGNAAQAEDDHTREQRARQRVECIAEQCTTESIDRARREQQQDQQCRRIDDVLRVAAKTAQRDHMGILLVSFLTLLLAGATSASV